MTSVPQFLHQLSLNAVLSIGLSTAVNAQTEINFPQSRGSVGVDEFYEMESYDNWTVVCVRDANNEDFCEATTFVSDHAAGVQFEFIVAPLIDYSEPTSVTVDVAPRALLSIVAASQADHYSDLSVSLSALDGVLFDGYRCSPVNFDACDQGPDLVVQDVRTLTSANIALLEIRDTSSDELVTEIEVSLDGFVQAYSRANTFNAEILGIDLTDTRNIGEMCNFIHNGEDKRISYYLDSEAEFSRPSRREDWLGPQGQASCPSYVILAYFTPDMTPAQRNLFCLAFDAENGEYQGIEVGETDEYRVCSVQRQSLCERINGTKNVALATIGTATAITGGGAAVTTATGVTVVSHSSGLAILTGGAGYISGTIGPLAATVGLLTAPATLAAAAVSVVAVGGAIYVCS